MSPLLIAYGLFGLVVGSFLNVCIHRIPKAESVVFPGSHCPQCGAKIRPWDNVPVLAYLWLRGRCRDCRAPISAQYPAVELLNGAAWMLCAREWGFTAPTYVNSLLLSALLVLFLVDFQHQILPNVVTIPGALAGVILSPFQSPLLYTDALTVRLTGALFPERVEGALPFVGSLLGAVIGAGILLVVSFVYEKLRKIRGLGLGDVKMMAMVGAFLGWRQAVLTIFAGSFAGAAIGIILILFGGRTLQSRMAFGTFLAVGALLSLFFGPAFYNWYLATR